VGAAVLRFPVILNEVVLRCGGLAKQERNQLCRSSSVVKRRNQRLHDADGSVVSARVAPGLEIVRLVDVPLAELGGFVVVEPKVYADRSVAVLERVAEAEVGRRVVNRVPAEDD